MTHITLVGMPGSGKSSTAAALSAASGLLLRDVDEIAAGAIGLPVAQAIREHGEAAFRDAEAEGLAAVLDGEPAAVACGAGAVLAPVCRALLRRAGVVTVWLTATEETVAVRLASSRQDRPLLDTPGAYGRLWHERRRHYLSVADVVVATDRRTPTEVARLVMGRVGIAVAEANP